MINMPILYGEFNKWHICISIKSSFFSVGGADLSYKYCDFEHSHCRFDKGILKQSWPDLLNISLDHILLMMVTIKYTLQLRLAWIKALQLV